MFTLDQIIEADGDSWKIVGVGVTEGEETVLHLSSQTRGTQQKNGFRPGGMVCWVHHKTHETRRCL